MPTLAEIDAEIARRLQGFSLADIDAEIAKREFGSMDSSAEIPGLEQPYSARQPANQEGAQGRFANSEIMGAAETALTMGTGATTGAIGGVAGALNQFSKEVESGQFGTADAANRIRDKSMQEMQRGTRTPQSQTGKRNVETIGEVAGAVGTPFMGPATSAGAQTAATMLRSAGMPDLPTTANKKEVARLLADGSKDDITATFELVPGRSTQNPRVRTDKEATAAVKQGFSEGSIASLKASTPSTQINFDKMLDIAESIKREEAYGMRNRPSDVLGDSLMQRVNVLMAANKRAGFSIDRIAKSSLAGQKVDLSGAADNFSSALGGFGVNLVDNGKGGFKADFENSILPKGDRGPINEVIRLMNVRGQGETGGLINGLTAHDMKRAIDNNVTFGAVKTGISSDGAKVLKNFRRDIDSVLDESFPDYNDANVAYAGTIEVLNDFQDVAGRKMNLSGAQADKATGTLMRRIAGNAQSRVQLLDSIDAIDAAVKTHGNYSGQKLIGKDKKVLFDDDLETQVMLANQLDSVVGIAPVTSLQGIFDASLARNLAQAGTTGGSTGLVINVAEKMLNKALQRNDKAAIKAARALVRKELAKSRKP
jgi:hypothetical protein